MEKPGGRKEKKRSKSHNPKTAAAAAGGDARGRESEEEDGQEQGAGKNNPEEEQESEGDEDVGLGSEADAGEEEEEEAEEKLAGVTPVGFLQQQQQMMVQMLAAQQQQQQLIWAAVQQLVGGQAQQALGAGPSMVPLPISASAARQGVSSAAGAVKRSLFTPPASAVQAGVWGATAPKQLELEKLVLFQGEMDSDKLDAWLRRLMVHCSYYGGKGRPLEDEEEKVRYAAAHLEGAAADWWFAIMEGKVKTMQEFVAAVNGRFRSAVDADVAAEKLYRMKQQQGQSVARYAGLVQQLLLRIPDMAVSDRVRLFARGLLPHLAQKVREMRPSTLEQAVELAIRYEGSFDVTPGGKGKGAGGGGETRLNALTLEAEGDDESEEQQRPADVEQKMELILAAVQKLQQPRRQSQAGQPPVAQGRMQVSCFRCGDRGHRATDCSFTEDVCYNCREKGHRKAQCTKPRRGRGGQQGGVPGGAGTGNG